MERLAASWSCASAARARRQALQDRPGVLYRALRGPNKCSASFCQYAAPLSSRTGLFQRSTRYRLRTPRLTLAKTFAVKIS